MAHMFHNCATFNQSLDNWDVSQVIDMSGVFQSCFSFNQPLDSWNVENVEDMSEMFYALINSIIECMKHT